jgi:hypothetical protein
MNINDFGIIIEELGKHKDIISLIPFDPTILLPNTVVPGTVINFFDEYEKLLCIDYILK